MRLSPSVLSADWMRLKEQLDACAAAGVTTIHFDVMDGAFVPAISFGDPILKSIKAGYPSLFMDVHMMVEEPSRFFDMFREAGADGITVHYEACRHVDRSLQALHQMGLKAGIALNPGSPVSLLEDLLPEADMVLLMSVNPGFGGQKFIPYVMDKIRALDRIRKERGLDFEIQVDGGVNRENAGELVRAGVCDLVAGSAVFKGDIRENCEMLYQSMNGGIK